MRSRPLNSLATKRRWRSSNKNVWGIGFPNAIGRPKKGFEKARGRARGAPKYVSLGGFRAPIGASGGSVLASWQVFERSLLAGLDSGLRVDPSVGHGLPTQRAALPGCRVAVQRVAMCIRRRTRLGRRSLALPRSPYPREVAADSAPGEQGSSRSPAAQGSRR